MSISVLFICHGTFPEFKIACKRAFQGRECKVYHLCRKNSLIDSNPLDGIPVNIFTGASFFLYIVIRIKGQNMNKFVIYVKNIQYRIEVLAIKIYNDFERNCHICQKYSIRSFYMNIKRDKYLNDLINRMHNGMIKVVTGIRRCGNHI